jgi:hypothetical protein
MHGLHLLRIPGILREKYPVQIFLTAKGIEKGMSDGDQRRLERELPCLGMMS